MYAPGKLPPPPPPNTHRPFPHTVHAPRTTPYMSSGTPRSLLPAPHTLTVLSQPAVTSRFTGAACCCLVLTSAPGACAGAHETAVQPMGCPPGSCQRAEGSCGGVRWGRLGPRVGGAVRACPARLIIQGDPAPTTPALTYGHVTTYKQGMHMQLIRPTTQAPTHGWPMQAHAVQSLPTATSAARPPWLPPTCRPPCIPVWTRCCRWTRTQG